VQRAGDGRIDQVIGDIGVARIPRVVEVEGGQREDVEPHVEDEPETVVTVTEDARAVDRDEALRVDRRPKQVDVEPTAVVVERRRLRTHAIREGEHEQARRSAYARKTVAAVDQAPTADASRGCSDHACSKSIRTECPRMNAKYTFFCGSCQNCAGAQASGS
jgi:hypothetical protein